ncbi:MAG TPA: helix-turn-helix domain-containing protein [Actinomycetota bacterium]|nr:helix-turn-helix domain-containing protein [Actinomycetota bacterium]
MEGEPQGFGLRLRTARIHAGLSQSALEGRSGIPKARLSRYENGHVLPSIETLGRLAAALEVSEASLLGDQRAIVEEFFNVLFRRGIRIYTVEQATRLADAVAEILETATPAVESVDGSGGEVASATMSSLTEGGAAMSGSGHPAVPDLVPPA